MKTKPHSGPRSGQSMLMMLLSLFMLCLMGGLAVDYGMLVLRGAMLQQACDAAALDAAGGYFTKRFEEGKSETTAMNEAKSHAVLVAAQNKITITTDDVVFTGTLNTSTPRRVIVRASLQQDFLLARILGIMSANLTRQATAEISPTKGTSGTAPLVITVGDYTQYKGSGTPITVQMERLQEGDFTNGEMIGMDIRQNSAKSPSQWEDEVRYGSTDPLHLVTGDPVGTAINADLGNQSTRLRNAIRDRLNSGKDTLVVMISDPQPMNTGTVHLPMRGLATIRIHRVDLVNRGTNAVASLTFEILSGGLLGPEEFTDLYSAADLGSSPILVNTYALRLVDDL